MMRILFFYSVLLLSTLSVAEEDICKKAIDKIFFIIPEWYYFVKGYGAENKNPDVIAMYRDYQSGNLESVFMERCESGKGLYFDIYQCFSGVSSGLGAAMCMHPDTNKNNWLYE